LYVDNVSNNFGKQGQDVANKAADKVQSGIRTAQDVANRGADKLSEGIDSVRRNTGPTLAKATDQVQSVANQAMDSLSSASKRVRATVADVGDSVVTHTQDNPVKAILISAAVGAIIATAVTTLSRTRD
jgi:ElaB/YqjD/DUF883 family membrane-anchored ribosome-binding protein